MPERSSFDYALIRVVPRVERGEFINAGAIVFCRVRRYLAARLALDARRLLALAPSLDAEAIAEITTHLESIPRICEGGTAAGPIGAYAQAERFHWLVAPRSTVVQTSPVHCGLCDDPAAALDQLMATLVLPAEPGSRP